MGHRFAQTRPPRSHQSATQGVSGRGKRRLVQTTWGGIPARYTKVPTCYVFFLAEDETNVLFNPCSSVNRTRLGLDDYSTLHVLVHVTADCITGEREGSDHIGLKGHIGDLARLDAVG